MDAVIKTVERNVLEGQPITDDLAPQVQGQLGVATRTRVSHHCKHGCG